MQSTQIRAIYVHTAIMAVTTRVLFFYACKTTVPNEIKLLLKLLTKKKKQISLSLKETKG